MRKLDRANCPVPPCLARYQYGVHTWDDVSSAHKAEIRAHLEMMQGKRCAYCEGDIVVLDQHIEHFRRKGDPAYRHLTFDWNNLFWSCNQTDSCGHFKDRGAVPYNVAELINPCVDDPDHFFVFRSDGTISVRRDLSAQEEHRAKETLRVFSLDADWGRLRAMRKAAVSGYLIAADEAAGAGFSSEDVRAYFAAELEYAKDLPFYTAIRHVLTERQ
ncbi:retron system putative HNH endonuclease [Bradyrhizobium sp.]|uniref:retron system putative HNH endonuclease n=1 Tax=Bradyrhizobium sp. TaxID=376 RepID=UPI002620EC3E|nr:retron system putative HNH endonuclease [Bradyrhizobium sp.]